MKETKIYRDSSLVAENYDKGWVIFCCDNIKWLKKYIKKNKDNIKDYSSLLSLVRSYELGKLKENIFGEKDVNRR